MPIDSDAEVIRIDVGSIIDAGYCQVCGTELPDKRYKYCDEHNPSAKNKPSASAVKRTRKATGGAKPTESRTAGSFEKLLLVTTAMIAWARIRRMGIPDADGSLADELSMTNDEAAPISRTLARLTLSNDTTARIIKPIVENEDLIDTAFALWEWNKRTDAALAQYREGTANPPRRQRNVNQRQTGESQPADDGTGTGEGIVDSGWSAESDFRSLV